MNHFNFEKILRLGCFCSKETITIKSRKYYVKEIIGEGGFSTVYLVEDNLTNRLYAVKKVICHSSEDEVTVLNEIKFHSLVNHEYVLKLKDYEKESVVGASTVSQVYLVLPYFERGSLLQELDRRGRSLRHFRPVEILEIFLKICEGVKAFHECEPPLAHRDLKTANILLTNGDTPVIMDLGSTAEARLQITSSGQAQALQDLAAERCSMPYRAPELFHVETNTFIDERTDIWSPFDAVYERGDSVALAVLSGNVFFSEGQLYGEEMENLIRFMLQVNPLNRPFISSVIEKISTALTNARCNSESVSV